MESSCDWDGADEGREVAKRAHLPSPWCRWYGQRATPGQANVPREVYLPVKSCRL